MMLFRHAAAVLAVAASAIASDAVCRSNVCNRDNCYRAVIASAFPTRDGRADCAAYFGQAAQTVTPVASTVTVYSTQATSITTYTTTVVSSTSTDTESFTTTEVVDTVTAQATETISTTTVFFEGAEKKKRAISSATIPAYASACSGYVRYSSACSCAGVTATPTTIAAPTVTVTKGSSGSTAVQTIVVTQTSIVTETTSTTLQTQVTATETSTSTSISVIATATAYPLVIYDYTAGRPYNNYLVTSVTNNGAATLSLAQYITYSPDFSVYNGMLVSSGPDDYQAIVPVLVDSSGTLYISGAPADAVGISCSNDGRYEPLECATVDGADTFFVDSDNNALGFGTDAVANAGDNHPVSVEKFSGQK